MDIRDRRTKGGPTLRARYLHNVWDWAGGNDRMTTRHLLRARGRRKRLMAMHMAVFYTLGDHLSKSGCVGSHHVGSFVNGILRGEFEIPPNRRTEVMPLVRLYRRTAAAVV